MFVLKLYNTIRGLSTQYVEFGDYAQYKCYIVIEVNNMRFGDTLRCLIEDNDITQKEVAQALNIAPTTLGNYIRNLREPDFKTLVAIANYFDVSTDFLLNNISNRKLSNEEERLLNIYEKIPSDNKKLFLEIGKLMNK